MWKIVIKRQCLRELSRMPRYVQARFKQIFLAKEQVANPFDPQEMGAKLKKLQKEDNFYKVRIGSYRVGIYLDKEEKILKVVTIFPREEDYRHFP